MLNHITDTEAMDRLAAYLARPGGWNGGDVCDLAAQLVIDTGRPDPSDGERFAGDADAPVDTAPPAYLDALAARHIGGPCPVTGCHRTIEQQSGLCNWHTFTESRS